MNLKKFSISLMILGSLVVTGTAWGAVYHVQPGDSLYNIAARYGTTISALMQSNGLNANSIYPGQALNINAGNAVVTSGSNYTVHPGDTLFLLSQKFGIPIESLKQTNKISSNYLMVGQHIQIPSNSSNGSSSTIPTNSYQVQAGDTIYLIAQRYGVSVATLTQANNLATSTAIYPGQTLKIPKSTQVNTNTTSYYGFTLSQSDLNLLARLVTAESDGEPYDGQVAVASTVLNRLRDPRYPKTIPGIIYQIDSGSYQYSPVLDGRINQSASASAYQAVLAAYGGLDPSHGADGFYNPAKTSSQWVRSNPVTAVIGNHVFFNY